MYAANTKTYSSKSVMLSELNTKAKPRAGTAISERHIGPIS